jgi:hypothetical protein
MSPLILQIAQITMIMISPIPKHPVRTPGPVMLYLWIFILTLD